MLFYTGTTLAAAMYIVGAVEIVLVSAFKLDKNLNNFQINNKMFLVFPISKLDIHGAMVNDIQG